MKQDLAVPAVLGDGPRLAPVDEHVAILQKLHAALRGRREAVGRLVRPHGPRRRCAVVQLVDAGARRGMRLVDGRRVRAIVEERNALRRAVRRAAAEPRVVLKGKDVLAGQRKVGAALVPAELPDDIAGCAVDFEDGGDVSRRDEIVALVVLVDAVDVEIVPRVSLVPTGAGKPRAKIERERAFCELLISFGILPQVGPRISLLGSTWSRLCHSNKTSPVSISSSTLESVLDLSCL